MTIPNSEKRIRNLCGRPTARAHGSTSVLAFLSLEAKRNLTMKLDRRFLAKLRLAGIIEGISTLILFGVAMPLKYLAGIPLAVTVAGSIHGFLFVLLVTLFVMGTKRIPISRGLAVAGVAAAIVPFGPFIVDRRLSRIETDGLL